MDKMDLNENHSQNITFQENNKSHLVEIVKMRTDALIKSKSGDLDQVWRL
jgi:hypothetical protein